MNIERVGALLSPALLLTAMLTSSDLLADWTGGIEGGQVIDGADKGSKIRFNISNSDRPFSQAFYADWIRGDGSTYEVGYTPRYWFTEKTYAFGEGSVKNSNAFNIDRQTRALAGVGIQLIDSESRSLFAEAGAGQLMTKYEFDNATTDTDSSGIATARIGAIQVLGELIKFEINADYSSADETIQQTAEAGVSVRVPGGAVKYSRRFRSIAIGDLDATDVTDSSVSFNYGF